MSISKEEMDAMRQQLLNELRPQILEEVKDQETKQREAILKKKQEERNARTAYVQRMQESPQPWVEIIGMVNEGENKTKIELEWNSSFVEFLRKEGITGIDDDQIVQKWVALLLKDIADDLDSSIGPEKETEFA